MPLDALLILQEPASLKRDSLTLQKIRKGELDGCVLAASCVAGATWGCGCGLARGHAPVSLTRAAALCPVCCCARAHVLRRPQNGPTNRATRPDITMSDDKKDEEPPAHDNGSKDEDAAPKDDDRRDRSKSKSKSRSRERDDDRDRRSLTRGRRGTDGLWRVRSGVRCSGLVVHRMNEAAATCRPGKACRGLLAVPCGSLLPSSDDEPSCSRGWLCCLRSPWSAPSGGSHPVQCGGRRRGAGWPSSDAMRCGAVPKVGRAVGGAVQSLAGERRKKEGRKEGREGSRGSVSQRVEQSSAVQCSASADLQRRCSPSPRATIHTAHC